MAAAGLWTTALTLARYVLENEQSLLETRDDAPPEAMTKEMLTWGLGIGGLGCKWRLKEYRIRY